MGRIFYILGKSSTGKDTIYKKLVNKNECGLKNIVMYTTRPMRDGETDGVTYNYVTEEKYKELENNNLIIESRAYNTVHGLWRYFTVKDEQIDLENNNYIIIGVLQSFISTSEYFGKDTVIPIYVEVEDGERLLRAVKREMKPGNHKYAELCRRFLADMEDFSEEKLSNAGIDCRFVNSNLNECINEIEKYIYGFVNGW